MSADTPARVGSSGPVALPRWQRRAIGWSTAAVVATGMAWLVASWPPGSDAASWSAAGREAATWSLRFHGVAAYTVLVVVGSVLPLHLRLGWQRHRNRVSGSILVAWWLALAATGLWLYYGGEAARSTVSLLHWAVGLGLPVILLVHRALGRWSRRASAPSGRE